MFDKYFKKIFKSRKNLTPEQVEELEKQLQRLQEDIKLREAQVVKLGRLLLEDPVKREIYAKRLNVHNRIILDNKQKMEEIEMKLLDK
jgi:hypothetical protein